MKKILSLVLVVVLLLTAVGGTLAYFTDNDEAVNVFTLGNVKIDLEEPMWKEPENVTPGITYPKDPYVKNVGNNPAWIRVDVTLSDAAAFMAAAEAHNITDLTTIFTIADNFDEKWELAGTPVFNEETDILTYSYYYQELVAVKGETDRLFTAVTVPAEFNNAQMAKLGENFTITLTAHAIQDTEEFDTVQEAFAEYVFEAKAAV